MKSLQLKVSLAILVALPSLALRLLGRRPSPVFSVFIFGGAIVASAFLLA